MCFTFSDSALYMLKKQRALCQVCACDAVPCQVAMAMTTASSRYFVSGDLKFHCNPFSHSAYKF